MCAFESAMVTSGLRIRFTPPASARSDSPRRRLLHGQVDRDERRGAGRVDRQAGPARTEEVRQPPRRDAVRRAGGGVGVERLEARVPHQLQIVDGRQADEDARARFREAIGVDAGVLQRLPRDLEQQALLRIHALRFARRDAEEVRVETIDLLQKAAPAR